MSHFLKKRGWRNSLLLCAATICSLSSASDCLAVTHLQRGVDAPPIAVKDRNGADVTNASLRRRSVILIFGEAYHDKTREAWAIVQKVLTDERLVSQPIVPVLITADEIRAEELQPFATGHVIPVLVRDRDRQAFGAFRVVVMPSVVIIAPDGRVVHAVGGLVPRFGDMLTDSLLHACGKLSAEGLDKSLNPPPTTQPSENQVRADRIAHLASQLVRRGLSDMAAEKYHETLELNPKHAGAHLGLAGLLLGQRQLADAETQFRIVLAEQPDSLQATLGLAYVQTLRGGSELDQAEKSVRGALANNPAQARAHYLLGLIYEQRNKPAEAAASFKKASELLLDRAEQE